MLIYVKLLSELYFGSHW